MDDKFYVEVKDFHITASISPCLTFTLIWGVKVGDKIYATSWRQCLWRITVGDQARYTHLPRVEPGKQKWYPPNSRYDRRYTCNVKVTPDLYDLVLTKLKESGKEPYLYERWAKWLKKRVMVEQIKRGEMNL